jgi:superfamily I DNA and/or RNA helicase
MSEIPVSPLVDLLRQYKLLQQECEYEKETFYQQTQQAGVPKRVRQGVCWYPVTAGKSYHNALNQLVVEITRGVEEECDHQFEHGRPVCFFTVNEAGRLHYFPFPSVISYVREECMVVTLPHTGALLELQRSALLGVQLFFDGSSYKVMFSALQEVMRARGNRLEELREVLLGSVAPRQREMPAAGFTWLNRSQEQAVNRMLRAREVAVIHGPPGTGKTTTLVETIHETLRRENQVLVCAQSNMAVDWISEQLLDRGIHVLRVGNPTRVNDKMLSFTYEKRFEQHPSYPELRKARKEMHETTDRLKSGKGKNKEARLRAARERVQELELLIERQLFDEARVIACTLIGSANKLLVGRRFSTLFIDEAAQALEAACWVAIARADRLVLAGDPCQLPPTIKCYEAAKGGLGLTLIQKLAARKPETVSMLEIQYRMHETIMRFPSAWFYQNRLQAAPEVSRRNILEYDTTMVWYDTSALDLAEAPAGEHPGRVNKPEAERMTLQLQQYIEEIGTERVLEEGIDFGVISPYRLQVQYIRHLVKRERFFVPFRRLITIHTVDGFQGQERDVIFISLVRANEQGNIGFLNDLRRMNVAITRARMKLIIWGDASTLTRHPFYHALYRYIQKHGKVVSLQAT